MEPSVTWSLYGVELQESVKALEMCSRETSRKPSGITTPSLHPPQSSPALWGSISAQQNSKCWLWEHCTGACGLRRGFPACSCNAGAACPPPPGEGCGVFCTLMGFPLQDTEVSDGLQSRNHWSPRIPWARTPWQRSHPLKGACTASPSTYCILGDLIWILGQLQALMIKCHRLHDLLWQCIRYFNA